MAALPRADISSLSPLSLLGDRDSEGKFHRPPPDWLRLCFAGDTAAAPPFDPLGAAR